MIFAGNNPEAGEANSQPIGGQAGHLGENRPGRTSVTKEAYVPGNAATEELVWPNGHSSREVGNLVFYVKCTNF